MPCLILIDNVTLLVKMISIDPSGTDSKVFFSFDDDVRTSG